MNNIEERIEKYVEAYDKYIDTFKNSDPVLIENKVPCWIKKFRYSGMGIKSMAEKYTCHIKLRKLYKWHRISRVYTLTDNEGIKTYVPVFVIHDDIETIDAKTERLVKDLYLIFIGDIIRKRRNSIYNFECDIRRLNKLAHKVL